MRREAPAAAPTCFRRCSQRSPPAAITNLRRYAHVILQRAQDEHRPLPPRYRSARAICRLLPAQWDETVLVFACSAARASGLGSAAARQRVGPGDGGRAAVHSHGQAHSSCGDCVPGDVGASEETSQRVLTLAPGQCVLRDPTPLPAQPTESLCPGCQGTAAGDRCHAALASSRGNCDPPQGSSKLRKLALTLHGHRGMPPQTAPPHHGGGAGSTHCRDPLQPAMPFVVHRRP